MSKVVDFQNKWAIEIGQFFVAFGSIEGATYLLLQTLPSDPIYPATLKLPFAQRIDLLLSVIAERSGPEWLKLRTLLEQSRGLAEDRNLIAHNPLGLDVYLDEAGEPALKETIRSARKPDKHISYSGLVELRKKAETLVSALYETNAALRASSSA